MAKINTPSVESILNTVIDVIIAIDENGIMQSVNPAVEKLFGYTPAELIGKNVSMLMPDPYSSKHDQYLRNYLRSGEAKIIGIGREVVGKKKDGTVFPIYLGVSEGKREGNARFFTGVIRDITDMKRYQDSLKKQNEFTAAVLNTVRSLVMVLDKYGRIVNFNRACEETTGYSFQEVAGKHFWDFFVPFQEKDIAVRNFLVSDSKKFPNHFETIWLTKDGDKRLVAWFNSGLFDRKGGLEYVIGTGIDITERRHLEKMVLEVTRKEQQRIGQELHDGLAQHLTSTAIVAKVLEKKLAESPSAKDAKRVVTLLNQAVSQTRELAQGLYAMQSDDLVSSLKRLAKETEKMLGIRCEVELPDGNLDVKDDRAMHIYRIAREAVNNAVKHGQGKNIRIWFGRKGADFAELVVENDGNAFIRSEKKKGMGMHIMRSRAAVLNASLSIEPRSKGGATVSCVLPLTK